MKHLFTLSLLVLGGVLHGWSQSPRWAEDVAPILFENCASCHNPKGVAPFPLLTYNDAYNQRFGIKAAVTNRSMPPWKADPNYTHFAGERILTDAEINLIRRWVDGGAPTGNLAVAPTPPQFLGGPQIERPDLVLTIPTYTVNTTKDLYRVFALPANITTDRMIEKIEVIPGNRSIVHHVLAYRDTSSIPLKMDAADPLPGFTNFGGTGSTSSDLIMAWVPGQGPQQSPAGMGIKLPARSNIILQIHYPGGIVNQKDSTRIVVKFAASNRLREVSTVPILNHSTSLTNGPLQLAPNTTRTFNAQFRLPVDATLLSIAPHMHLIGRRIKVYGITLQGDTIRLINIPEWDFNWQGSYNYPRLVKLPRGTQLKAEAFYDNTEENPFNPSFPPKTVRRGEATTDEMMLVYFTFTAYQSGDEKIIIDSSAVATSNREVPLVEREKVALEAFPNPAQANLTLRFALPQADDCTIAIYDQVGDLVKTISTNERMSQGQHQIPVDLHDLPNGAYFLKVSSLERFGLTTFVKVE